MKMHRHLLLLLLPPLAVTLSACGALQSADVAVVKTPSGTVHITKVQFNRLVNYTVARSQNKAVTAKATKLVPPNFTACVTELRKTTPAGSDGAQRQPAELRKSCAKQYQTARDSTLSSLLGSTWAVQEAASMKVPVRKAAVARQRAELIKQTFQGQAAFEKFLKDSGLTSQDVDGILSGGIANQAISTTMQKRSEKAKAPTDAQAQKYFAKHQAEFVEPPSRNLRVVLASSEARAREALAALRAGGSWTKTAAKYSIDEASKGVGGVKIGATTSTEPVEFADTVFKAKVGELVGPVKTDRGWYVVKVQSISGGGAGTFALRKAEVKRQMTQANAEAAANRFQKDYKARWDANTTCADEYKTLTACQHKPFVAATSASAGSGS